MGKGIRIGATLPLERIQQSILLLRAHKVMLDFDLAALYGVQTVLNKSGEAQSSTLSSRLHVRVERRGVRKLEVPIWHLKIGRPAIPSLRVQRAGCRHAFERFAQ